MKKAQIRNVKIEIDNILNDLIEYAEGVSDGDFGEIDKKIVPFLEGCLTRAITRKKI